MDLRCPRAAVQPVGRDQHSVSGRALQKRAPQEASRGPGGTGFVCFAAPALVFCVSARSYSWRSADMSIERRSWRLRLN